MPLGKSPDEGEKTKKKKRKKKISNQPQGTLTANRIIMARTFPLGEVVSSSCGSPI
jgi:hypothetical protein